ncbi:MULTISPECIES: DNA-processing protein DprA [Aminobacterium]|jgi:DNA processing protein|uniref:DNA-processing protein DprA n=1 Tax=Aminobacterium TaxID=81466 RepID=UPI002579B906|nr:MULTISPECIES: DNA-processing protein DprA [unclassified Aminobacterium]
MLTPSQEALLIVNALGGDRRLWHRLVSTKENLYDLISGKPSCNQKKALTEKALALLYSCVRKGWAQREVERCCSENIRILFWGEKNFPSHLLNLKDTPLVLYVRGHLAPQKRKVAVVGTRRSSSYGQHIAQALGKLGARQGWILLSGGALGIDGAAHGGCLEEGGQTIAVLAHGLDHVYPQGHKELFHHILDDGALITEYPLGVRPAPWHFPKRNRIIAGLADKIVVVEAPQRSGAIITARLGLEMGKEIWAVPGRIDEKVCWGSNKLIYDGAYPLVSLEDFSETLGSVQLDFSSPLCEKKNVSSCNMTEKEQKILELLRSKGDRTVDNLSAEGKMTAADVIISISNLSAMNLIYQSGPGRWRASLS